MDDEIAVRVGTNLYVFDGRVLEIFGGNPIRFHVRHLQVLVKGPDRKGNRIVELCHGLPEAPGVRHTWKYSAAEWSAVPELARLLDVVREASVVAKR